MAAQPNPAPAPDPDPNRSLRKLIRDELEKSNVANPYAIVDTVMAAMTDDQWEVAAAYGVTEMIAESHLNRRRTGFRQPDPTKPSPKWAKTAAAARERPDI